MSQVDHQDLAMVSPKAAKINNLNSKKRAQPEQMSSTNYITDFFQRGQQRTKLSNTQDGGSLHLIESNINQIQDHDDQGESEVTPSKKEEIKDKQSTASSQSPDEKYQFKLSENPRQVDPNKDQTYSQNSRTESSMKAKGKRKRSDQSSQKSNKNAKTRSTKDEDEEQDEGRTHENRDYCNVCKDGGELVCCDRCPRSFHLKCLNLTEADIPEGNWYCDRCKPVVDKRLALEEEKRKRAEEREKQLQEKRAQQEQLKKEKEKEAEKKREEKRKEKERQEEERNRIKEQQLEQLKAKISQSREQSNVSSQNLVDNKIEAPSPKKSSPQKKQEVSSVNSPQIKKSKKVNKAKDIDEVSKAGSITGGSTRKVDERSEAEKSKEAKSSQIRQLLKIFARTYPELVDKHSIKYPIEDQLIKKVPLLHGAENFPEKPEPKKVLLEGERFEKLLYIWEFFNNFTDFLDIGNFKLEELQAALNFDSQPDQVQLFNQKEASEEENLTWEQKMTQKAISEAGFGLITSLHCTLLKQFLNEVSPSDKNKVSTEGDKNKALEDEEKDPLLSAVKKHVDNYELIWPEMIRLVLMSTKRFDFHPLDEQMMRICDKLSGCQPETYSSKLTYDEKTELLAFLIDSMHDLDEFRSFLNSRLEEKSSYNKQKMDIYVEIKQLENQKSELIKEHAQSNFFNNSEEIMKRIDELKVKLEQASRTESRKIKDQIFELQAEKNKILREMEKIEEQIEKRHMKIERLNEQAHKTSIKTQMLGKDADKNEYWFFKEEPGKLFIKKQEQIKKDTMMDIDENQENIMDIPELPEPKYHWFFYDEEEEFEKLVEACNTKGIRERKLQENLKKIRDRMKMKKGSNKNKSKADDKDQTNAQNKEEEKEEEQINTEQQESQNTEQEQAMHHLFENDNWYQALHNAIWFNRKMPGRKKGADQAVIQTRRGMVQQIQQNQKNVKQPEDDKINLESLKQLMLSIEEFYSDASLHFQREWETLDQRQEFRQQVKDANTISQVSSLLLRLDVGFCQPNYLKLKDDKGRQEESDNRFNDSDQNMDNISQDEDEDKSKQGDKRVLRMKVLTFKFWYSQELRDVWRNYIFQECVNDNNINALYIALKILQRATDLFVQRHMENHLKKQRKAERQHQRNKEQIGNGGHKQQRGALRNDKPDYKQFFESDSELDQSDSEGHNERSKKVNTRGRGRKPKLESDSEMEIEDVSDSDVDEDVDDDGEEREWDDKCYICGKEGNVMCCETCSHVAHLSCTGLKKEPQGEWYCEDCLIKQSQRRTTRGQMQHQNNRQHRSLRSHR